MSSTFTKFRNCTYSQEDIDREVYSQKVASAPVPASMRKRIDGNKDIVFVRHAESCSNVATVFQFKRKFHQDSMLTSKGFKASTEAGKQMRRLFGRVKTIYCSTLPRAMLTAKLLGKSLGALQIVRIGGIEEQKHIFDREKLPSYNTITLTQSNQHAAFFNKHVFGPSIKPYVLNFGKGGVKHFESKVLPYLPKFAIVVSHKHTIKKLARRHLRHPMPTGLQNLDWVRLRL